VRARALGSRQASGPHLSLSVATTSSISNLYEKPEQPPDSTPNRRSGDSGDAEWMRCAANSVSATVHSASADDSQRTTRGPRALATAAAPALRCAAGIAAACKCRPAADAGSARCRKIAARMTVCTGS
jgi:hypothetical protein